MKKKTSKKKPARKAIRAKHWKRSTTIAADKFDTISKAILKALPKRGLSWGELCDKVADRLPKFPGSIPWYTISCLRELETQGKVKRVVGKPVMYFRL